ncbi:MAG: GNAT family N-acetyltransferase [Anaerolineae bacterium]
MSGAIVPPYEKSLGNGLTLRSVRNERDVERYSAFHFDLFHNTECVTVDRLLHYHPEISYEDFWFVEDESNGRIAATVCLVPWHCRFDEVELDMAQLEVVATHPDYRRRGLIRVLIGRFHERAAERNIHICAIGGIPYYYRQFGYAYAVDMAVPRTIPARAIPDVPSPSLYRLRPATPEDAPVMTRLYEQAMAPVQFHDKRSLAFWRYHLKWAAYPFRLVERVSDGEVVGYVCTWHNGAWVSESAIFSYEVGLAVLGLLKAEGTGDVAVGGPESGVLARIARFSAGPSPRGYQWLLHIPDIPRFLGRIAPVLERRLAGSAFAGLSADIIFNLFREAFRLRFQDGKLVDVQPLGFVDTSHPNDGGDIQIPPDAFTRLVCGYRDVEELRDAWPDIVIKPEVRLLVEELFPKMTSFLYLPYSYAGPVPDTAAGALSRNP